MSKAKSSIKLENISPIAKEAAEEWIKEVLASDEAGDLKSGEGPYEKAIRAITKEYKGKGPTFAKRKFEEIKPQIDLFISLFVGINDEFKARQKEMFFEVNMLEEQLKRLLTVLKVSKHAETVGIVFSNTAYPLSDEMADLFLSLNEKSVKTWDEMKKEEMKHMVREHFVSMGKEEIPLEWIFLRYLPAPNDSTSAKLIKEVRSAFNSPEDADDFLNGKDFNHGLLDVRDRDFDAAVEAFCNEVKSLAKKGELKIGGVLYPEAPPNLFMAAIPLVDKEWIDSKALAVLEWHKMIADKGYVMIHPEGDNSLAWPIVLDKTAEDEELEDESGDESKDESDKPLSLQGEGSDLNEDDEDDDEEEDEEDEEKEEEEEEYELEILEKHEQYSIYLEAEEHVKSLNLEERVIDGRTHVSLEDYFSCDGCLLNQGEFEIEEGIAINSWNRLVEERGGEGEAKIGEVPLFKMDFAIEPHEIQRIPTLEEALELQEIREECSYSAMNFKVSVSDPIITPDVKEKGIEDGLYIKPCPFDDQPIRVSIAQWRDSLLRALAYYLGMKSAITTISSMFLDGTDILVEDFENLLVRTLRSLSRLSFLYNDLIAAHLNELKAFKVLNWTDTQPFGWGALFPKGFLISKDEIEEAANEQAMSIFERYVKKAYDSVANAK